MVRAKVYILKKFFDGLPKESDLEIVEEELPPIQNGEFLAEALYITVDPYMRGAQRRVKLGGAFDFGGQIAKVIESKNPKYPVGSQIFGDFGWRTHTISSGEQGGKKSYALRSYVLPDLQGLPPSLSVGILGMPGCTAYFGFLELCKPKPGETVVVSGAAGAVGSVVGQIAKIKGCKVIGIAGSDEKGKWLVQELGFDHFINYKTANIDEELSKVAPNGIDCYFDNVGGDVSTTVMNRMNEFGRVSVCGQISTYNDADRDKTGTRFPGSVVGKQLKIEGFMVSRWNDRRSECVQQHVKWIKEGKLKYKETITEGFENTAKAFIEMLTGGNTGKAIVKV